MNPQSTVVALAKGREDREYSFFEALTFESKESAILAKELPPSPAVTKALVRTTPTYKAIPTTGNLRTVPAISSNSKTAPTQSQKATTTPKSTPIQAPKSTPIQAHKATAIQVQKATPIQAQKPTPAQTQKPAPAQTQKPTPAQTQKATPPTPTNTSTAGASSTGPATPSKTMATTKMASTRAQTQCLELCHKTTALGDRISIHVLEYLTCGKQLPHGFDALAHDFIDTCQILFSIEAGLGDCNRTGQRFPPEMITELDHKFRVTQTDFQILDQMLNKFLGSSGRVKRSWGKLFGDTDIKKMTLALGKTRESLRMSSLVFQWSLGSEKVEREAGIGYTALAAALDRLDNKNTPTGSSHGNSNNNSNGIGNGTNNNNQNGNGNNSNNLGNGNGNATAMARSATNVSNNHNGSSYHNSRAPTPPPEIEPLDVMERENSFQHQMLQQQQLQLQQQHFHHNHGSAYEGSLGRASSYHVRAPLSPEHPAPLTLDYRHQLGHGLPTPSTLSAERERHFSGATADAFERASTIDDARSMNGINEYDSILEDMASLDMGPHKVVRIKADPASMPRCQPRNSGEGDNANMKSALISAVRSKNHKLTEQLLSRGVSPNAGPHMHLLKEAILGLDIETVRLLLLYGADPNDPDRDGVTPLYAAVDRSFTAGATTLLKYGADPNLVAGPELESPLAAAVIANLVGFSHLLLTYGGDPNHVTTNGGSLLIGAINKKTPKKFIDLLLEYGAEANGKSREGKTALFEAIQAYRSDIVASLLEHGADANLPGPKHPLWPSTYHSPCLQLLLNHGADQKKAPGIMELAASLNNVESVRILLKAGVNPNTRKDGIYTPLCTAIRDDRPELVQLLLANGADPNVNASEYPAFKCITHKRLHFLPALVSAGVNLSSPKGIIETAVSLNNMEALNWLLDQGVNPNDKSVKGMSPLTTAIREDRIEMVDLLLLRGADPHMRGQDWPLCMAVKRPAILKRILSVVSEPQAFKGVMEMAVSANQLESVKLLLAAGVSVEDKNGGVFSPLTTALRENRRDIVAFLLNGGGADVNSPGEHLPIVKALRRFHGEDTEMLQLLLEHGADPNKMYRGWNAIMQGVENGDADILRMLSEKSGVDLDVKDELGRTVVEMAASRGWDEAVQILTDGNVRLQR